MPEKSLNQIPRPLREQYEKGLAAFERKNFDYAVPLLNQVLQQEPAFFACRQALRAAQFKRAGDGAGFFKKLIGGPRFAPMGAKGQMALKKNPAEALQIGEQILNDNPASSAGNKLIVDAALACDFPRTAVLSLEILVKNNPKDSDLAFKLAELYSELGEIEKAEHVFDDLVKARPNDPAIAQAMKDLAARKTMAEGGYDALADGQGSYRDILRNKEEAVALEQENRQVKDESLADRLIAEYEQRLKSEPNNLKLYRSLAELCVEKEDFDRALGYYERITSIEGTGDPSLEKSIADTTLRKFNQVIADLDPNSPDYATQAEALTRQRDEYFLQAAIRRAEKYPSDLQIRFELGQVYFRLGRINEAIQEFQKAQNHPHLRIQARS